MPAKKDAIKFFLNCEGKTFVLDTYTHEYRNLMMLIYDKVYLENFGECKGTGRCGTCHILIVDYDGELLTREGNENTTFSKMPFVKSNSRLACQMMVDEKLNGLTIEVIHDNDSVY
ncbi:2Fe-2S iron-sulfur cluster-binding protein [Chryseolinea sp. H1M3-3]|uniref:2Fe-2S iron-sulfur cluster-binding protein n=1 Tax=Chryseolinea sp. H1M3-3 TaxID=3034144 RepID=UPI0023EB155D|nr:2Fe-2S iron-sulfur cluster-binding protein [Chryseolinea sp. H1M3-3]